MRCVLLLVFTVSAACVPAAVQVACEDDADCGAGDRCAQGLCLPAAALPDAGVPSPVPSEDAGVADGGTRADGGSAIDGGSPAPDDAGPVPFDLGDLEFAPGLGRRAFKGAAEVTLNLGEGDQLEVDYGNPVVAQLNEHIDRNFGSLVMQVSLGRDQDTLTADQLLVDLGFLTVTVTASGDLLVINGANEVRASGAALGWEQDQPHDVSVRWNAAIGDVNGDHIGLDVDDTLVAGAFALDTSSSATAFSLHGPATFAAFTIFGRTLDNAEVTELVNADPIILNGMWDVLFALPMVQIEGVVDALDDDAWAAPLAENLAGPLGYLPGQIVTEAPANVIVETCAPVTINAGAPTARGVPLVITNSERGCGVYFSVPASRGDSFVVRAMAHGVGANARLELWERVGNFFERRQTLIGSPTATAASPDELMLSHVISSPSASALAVLVDNDVAFANGSSLELHRMEIYENLISNPSMAEIADVGQGNDIPAGWTINNTVPPSSMSAVVGRGAGQDDALRIVTAVAGGAHIRIEPVLDDGERYAVGAHFLHTSGALPAIHVTNGSLFAHTRKQGAGGGQKFRIIGQLASGFQHLSGVGWRQAGPLFDAVNDRLRFGGFSLATEQVVDDAYVVGLNRANVIGDAANREESSVGSRLRVDGGDRATQAIEGTSGTLTFQVEPRCVDGVIAQLSSDDALVELTMATDGLVADARGAGDEPTLAAGVSAAAVLTVEISWGTNTRVVVGGDVLVDEPSPFGSPPDLLSFGHDRDARRRCDLSLELPGATP